MSTVAWDLFEESLGSPTTRLVLLLAAASMESHILFRKLPPKVQAHVVERIRFMATEERCATLFDEELVAQNPAPVAVSNHWKWRVALPVLNRLRVPRFALECSLVQAAYPTRDLTRVDVGDIVRRLRVEAGRDMITLVGSGGLEVLSGLIQTTLPRIG